MNYTALSPVSPEDEGQRTRIDEDAVSMLSHAAPQSGYQAYRPPPGHNLTSQQQPTITYSSCSRLPTPPTHNPISWPGIFPSRTPSQSQTRSLAPSLGSRSRLFVRDQSYEEVLPWAESTHFRTESTSRPGMREDESRKQYHRNPRHLRRTWKTGASRRFPWKCVGSMGMVCLLTGSCIAILYASEKTTPESWPAGVQPGVYLSTMEVLMCLMTLCALAQGLAVSYWTTLLHGTTIGDMHDIYESRYLWNAIQSLCRLRCDKVGFATIMSALSLSRGPLFQRALVLRDGKYEINIIFLALGTIVSVVSIFSIILLYYGYWDLGRKVSLNPLEIARAFGAPMFDGVDGNVTARDIEVERGHLSVRYGAVERNGEEKVLRVESMEKINIRRPREGEIFG